MAEHEGRLRAAVVDVLHGDGYGIAHSGASCEQLADMMIAVVLGHAAEQIKARVRPLPTWTDSRDVLAIVLTVLAEMRGHDA